MVGAEVGCIVKVSKYEKYKVGDIFKGFLILKILVKDKNNHYGAVFECSCGTAFKRSFSNLIRNTSHGCMECAREYTAESKRKFKVKNRRLYGIWKGMNYRCNKEGSPAYEHYGARGIEVCSRWLDNNVEGFNNFYDDMGIPPSNRHSIDRVDVNGNYEPDNCRWATQTTQMNNTRVNHNITYKGEEFTLTVLARKFNIKPNTLEYRILRGWSVEDAIRGKRSLPWKRPYINKLTEEEFDHLLEERFECSKSLSFLSNKYNVDSGQLSRIFRRDDVISYYKNKLEA